MSKTTKVIAALGVVAGLGVAALPAFTYAESTVSGNADVLVQVQDAIAMTIAGNQDDVQDSGYDNVKVKSANITTIGGQNVADFELTSTKTSGSKVSMLPTSVIDGGIGDGATFKSTINVYTNANAYNLSIQDSDNNNALSLLDGSDTIPAGIPEGQDTTFTLTAGQAAWGYIVDETATNHGGYKAVPVNDGGSTSAAGIAYKANNNTETVVNYGVATRGTQKTGTYKDTIVYTATTNTTAPTVQP